MYTFKKKGNINSQKDLFNQYILIYIFSPTAYVFKNDEKFNINLRYLLLVAMYFFTHVLPMPCNGVHGFYLLTNNFYNHDFTCKKMEFQLIKTFTLISAAEAFYMCI